MTPEEVIQRDAVAAKGILQLEDRDAFDKWLPKNAVILEIGVQKGIHAESIMRHATPSHLYLIDRWGDLINRATTKNLHAKAKKFQEQFAETKRRMNHFLHCDYTIIDNDVVEAIRFLDDRSLDVAYIDGGHRTFECWRDIGLVLPKLKEGAILAGHDFAVARNSWGLGPVKAVIDFLQNGMTVGGFHYTGRMVVMSNHMYADWAIQLDIPMPAYAPTTTTMGDTVGADGLPEPLE